MVVDRVGMWRSKLEISVAFADGAFVVATVYDGEALTKSETRCSDIVTTGTCVHSRIERLQSGALTEQEREELGLILRRRAEELDAEIADLGLASV
jgi:hypothetical protein